MKIIAVRFLDLCEETHRKLLTEDILYYFYNNYEIDNDDKLNLKPGLAEDFFSNVKPKIEFSAIVGKNGSGKSTLIESIMRAINNLAVSQPKAYSLLLKIKGLAIDLYYETDTFYKARIVDKNVDVYKLDKRNNKFNIPDKKFGMADFFYSIVVNYSLYAYNFNDIIEEGNWLNGLFHKNDGYQTPIVLNPYRKLGNIDINVENELIRARLIANLLRHPESDNGHFKKLTDSHRAHSLILTLRNPASEKVLYTIPGKQKYDLPEKVTIDQIFPDEKSRDETLRYLNGVFHFGYRAMSAADRIKYKIVLDYILYKMVNIALKYFNPDEIVFLESAKKFNSQQYFKFIDEIAKDRSHVTLKLRQAINYIRFRKTHEELETGIKLEESQTRYFDDLASINKRILDKRNSHVTEGVELVPPPIFESEIQLAEERNPEKIIPFRKLSSGEKQMIYSVHSFLYHLSNLDSVPDRSRNRIPYRHIQIILEEIELYAHPEMQRGYVDFILRSIIELKLNRIQSINVCFVTHSPFILSDIPENNILFLDEKGLPLPEMRRMKTFGGNIHDLLVDSFFLAKGSIGVFAMAKIQHIIDELNNTEDKGKDSAENTQLLKAIELIGEPFLRDKLKDMYYLKYDKQKRIDQLEAELKKLRS